MIDVRTSNLRSKTWDTPPAAAAIGHFLAMNVYVDVASAAFDGVSSAFARASGGGSQGGQAGGAGSGSEVGVESVIEAFWDMFFG